MFRCWLLLTIPSSHRTLAHEFLKICIFNHFAKCQTLCWVSLKLHILDTITEMIILKSLAVIDRLAFLLQYMVCLMANFPVEKEVQQCCVIDHLCQTFPMHCQVTRRSWLLIITWPEYCLHKPLQISSTSINLLLTFQLMLILTVCQCGHFPLLQTCIYERMVIHCGSSSGNKCYHSCHWHRLMSC